MNKIVNYDFYKKRVIDQKIEAYLNTVGAICIEGPKWCGKTRTSSFHAKSEFFLADPLNNFQNRTLALTSIDYILSGETPRLIDEWQEVPSIWDAIRYEVDRRNKAGQFILTGSSTPTIKGILHSGAGRIAKIRMHTMSLYESGDSTGKVSLEELCAGKLTPGMNKETSLEDLADYAVRGGRPGNLKTDSENITILPTSYIGTIADDIKRTDEINYNSIKINKLLLSLARNESTTASQNKLIDDLKEVDELTIDKDTVSKYLSAFERLFIIENQLPFSTNVRSKTKLKQSPKRHFTDPSLACALLKLTPTKLIHDLNTFGFLFESLVERDLRIYADSFGGTLYHYQDYNDKEIDAVIELDDGTWCAFEIKLGSYQIDSAAKNLLKIKEKIEQDGGIPPKILCVIVGIGSAFYQRDDGVFVVPITALKN